jgi:hypothetical protein
MEMAIFTPLFRWALTGTTLVLMAAVAAPAQAPSLAMLDRLEKGRWQLTERGTQNALHSLCLGDARRMIQIRHPRSGCSRFVIEDKHNSVTVHYTCPGAGHGRTTIRSETNRLVQIDTQGIAEGKPFSQAIEARRVGACTGG